MKRSVTVLCSIVLVLAACGDDDAGPTTTPATAATSTTQTATSSTSTSTSTSTTSTTSTTTTTTTTTVPEPRTEEVDFEPFVSANPDPLETIEPLSGVTLTVLANGQAGFTFEEALYGDPNVALRGLPEGVFVSCSSFVEEGEATTSCFAQVGGEFPTDRRPTPAEFPPNTVWIPTLTVTPDTISIEVDGTVYTGDALLVEDGPVFVQIDPNTGGLAEPVTRRSGLVSAADLLAALSG